MINGNMMVLSHNGSMQYIPRNMHTVFALLCFVLVIHWLIFPYPSGLLHWHCGNLTIAPVPAKQPWWIWINTSCEFIMNDCITTTKQSTTKPCAYFLGYTVRWCKFCVTVDAVLIKLKADTVETLYNTVNFCWSTHKRHSIARPKGRGMGCLLWVQKATYCVDLSKLSSIKYLL